MDAYLAALAELQQLAQDNALTQPADVSVFFERLTPLTGVATGRYAEVYALPETPDKVVKLCYNHKDGYYRFARWCMRPENQSNRHVPRIFREDCVVISATRVVRIYVLERLSEISLIGKEATRPNHFMDVQFGQLWGMLRTLTLPLRQPQAWAQLLWPSFERFTAQLLQPRRTFYMNSADKQPLQLSAEALAKYDALLRTLYELLQYIAPLGTVDLHGGNYMLRGETVVITDPLANLFATAA
ncbi:MAG: hypothetical protein R3Y10_03620 [Ferrimonas sp.]